MGECASHKTHDTTSSDRVSHELRQHFPLFDGMSALRSGLFASVDIIEDTGIGSYGSYLHTSVCA